MTDIYKGALGVTPELARKILGDNYTADELEQINGAARVINDADIDSDTGQKIQQNTEAAKQAQATAEEADKNAGNAQNDATTALDKANEAKQIADANQQSIGDANGPLVGKNDHATLSAFGLVKMMQHLAKVSRPESEDPAELLRCLTQLSEWQNSLTEQMVDAGIMAPQSEEL